MFSTAVMVWERQVLACGMTIITPETFQAFDASFEGEEREMSEMEPKQKKILFIEVLQF